VHHGRVAKEDEKITEEKVEQSLRKEHLYVPSLQRIHKCLIKRNKGQAKRRRSP